MVRPPEKPGVEAVKRLSHEKRSLILAAAFEKLAAVKVEALAAKLRAMAPSHPEWAGLFVALARAEAANA